MPEGTARAVVIVRAFRLQAWRANNVAVFVLQRTFPLGESSSNEGPRKGPFHRGLGSSLN